jgi:nitrile hydratase accessory protein
MSTSPNQPPDFVGSPDLGVCPAIPRDKDGPVFNAPWEAQAFAMTVKLHEQGYFTWREWTERLTAEIAAAKSAGEVDLGTRYYEYWLAALEKVVADKGLLTPAEVARRKAEWETAVRETPQGRPIELRSPHSR